MCQGNKLQFNLIICLPSGVEKAWFQQGTVTPEAVILTEIKKLARRVSSLPDVV